MTKLTMRRWLVTAAFLVSTAGQAGAAVIFSNFGPGDSFNGTLSYQVVAGVIGQDIAMTFTVMGGNFTFTSAELALTHDGGTGPLTILLFADSGGLPGAILESFSIAVPGGPSIVPVTSALHPVLTAGTPYWLGTDATADFHGSWAFNDQGQSGHGAYNDGGPWGIFSNIDTAYRINGNAVVAVSEPSSLTSVALAGLIGLGAAWRRRRNAA